MSSASPEVRLVELAYQIERGSREWMDDVGRLLAEVTQGQTTYVQEFAKVDGRLCVTDNWADDRSIVDALEAVTHGMTDAEQLPFMPAPLTAGTARELLARAGIPFEGSPFAVMYERLGIPELFSVAAVGPTGQGVAFGVVLSDFVGPPPELRARLTQVGAHVAAGARLRRKLDGGAPEDTAEAILRADGKLEHLSGPALDERERLSDAVKRVERARIRTRDPDEALQLWQALVNGRWSLVDRFEGDGRSYYVAVANQPDVAEIRSLTRREAEVVSYIASGTDTKTTAYALGLDAVTVRSHLSAAMAKLGVGSRAELIRLRATLFDPTS